MASPELDTAGTEGDEKVIMSPSSDTFLGDTPAHLDFTQLTPSKFGISTDSFTPSSSNQKDKSRLAQLKARRRSNIGVRGSPETNSLIRYIAQQKMKTPPTQTPECVKSSPFLPKVPSTLRQKMASFQSIMDVQESEVCAPAAVQDSNTGGCIKTRDYLSAGRSPDGGKENRPPPMTPTPSKRRRVAPLRDCEEEIREASTSVLQHRKVDKKPALRAVTPGPTPSSDMVEEPHAALLFPPLHLDSAPPTSCELQACSPTKNQQEGLFELQSPSRLQPDGPAAALPDSPTSPFAVPSLPSLLEMKPTGFAVSAGECNCSETSAVKKKRVCFGGPLSPEFFDKNLPPSTPLQKGGTPARAPTPGGCFQPRSLLKTPQRSDAWSPLGQPDFNSASPTLAMPRNCRVQFLGEDGAETYGKIAFPSMEELDTLTDDADPDPEPGAVPSGTCQINALDQCEPQQEMETQAEPAVEAPALGPSINRKRESGPEPESTIEAPARSSSRKRKQPEENEPVKRSTRSAAKSASGKMKTTSRAKRQWGTKEVDRSLYGSREYASKNPTLSPITESLPPTSQSAQDQEPRLSLPSVGELINSDPITAALLHSCSPTSSNTQKTDDITATDPWENASAAPVESVTHSKGGALGKGRRRSGTRLRSSTGREVSGRGLKGRKVSVPVDDWLSKETQNQQTPGSGDQHCENQTTTNLEAKETSSEHSVPENGEVDADEPRTSADTPRTDTDRDAECLESRSLDAPTSACPTLDVDISNNVSVSERRSKGRRRCLSSSVLQDGEDQVSQMVEHQTSSQSSSDSQVEKEANLALAHWQAGFNFEDVFKPVATRGQRSVRRSLRNRSNVDNGSSGLAWLPRISPTSTKEACRRRTRGRRLSAALHLGGT